jgi:hypothetical protein
MFSPIIATPSDPLAFPLEGHAVNLGEPGFLALVVALIAITTVVVVRLDDVEASVLAGMVLLFVPLGVVQYYYACACLLVLLFHRRIERPLTWRLLALLFGLHAGLYALLLYTRLPDLCDNVATSWAYAIFLLACVTTFAARGGAISGIEARAALPVAEHPADR